MTTIGTLERARFEASADEEIVDRVKAGDTALLRDHHAALQPAALPGGARYLAQ